MYLLRIYIRSAAIQAGVAQLPYLARNARSAEVEANAPKSPVFPLALRSHLRPYSPRRPSSECPTIHSKVQPYQSIVARSGRNRIAPFAPAGSPFSLPHGGARQGISRTDRRH